jgi:hypothetical protein
MFVHTHSFIHCILYQQKTFKTNALPVSPLYDLFHPEDLTGNYILSFVGDGQYRFVGSVSRRFKEAYRTTFPEKTTRYNMSTMELAKICWEDAPKEDEWLLQNLAKEQTWYYIVCLDHLTGKDWELLQWTKSTFECSCGTYTPAEYSGCKNPCSVAAKNGHLEMLYLAQKKGFDWDTRTCTKAAENGHLEVLEWAYYNGCPLDKWSCCAAAENGHLNILQWAHEQNFPWENQTCRFAVENGLFKILQWSHENGRLWDEYISREAAESGQLDVLQWAHEIGCQWNEGTCCAAAENGHLELLKWAHENGCPWNECTCVAAAVNGHFEVWKYARDNGCPFQSVICRTVQGFPSENLIFDENANWVEIQRAFLEKRRWRETFIYK